MKKDKRIFGKVIMVLAVLFFYVPILFMIIFSFNSGRSLTNFDGFSLMWYERMFENRDMMESLQTTIVIALIATLVSTLLGTISAIGLSRCRKVLRKAVLQLNDFPIMNPEIVTAIGLMLLFITFHIERGFVTMLLAHIAFCTPYVILSVMPKIRSLDPNLADAAMDLGATPWQALTKVLVPQICAPVWRWFNTACIVAGLLDRPVPADWTAPRIQQLDPVKETDAQVKRIQAGLATISETLREMGREPEEFFREYRQDLDRLRTEGISVNSVIMSEGSGNNQQNHAAV